MQNVIYNRTTVPARKAPDGETPTQIVVTEEVNLYCVWRLSYEGTELLGTYHGGSCREFALEDAVDRILRWYTQSGGDVEEDCCCESDAEPSNGGDDE